MRAIRSKKENETDGHQWTHLVAGVVSGFGSKITLHPLDLVKTRLQVQDGFKGSSRLPIYSGIFTGFRSIITTEGFFALYTGLLPGFIGAGTSWGSYFFFYNAAKQYISTETGRSELSAKHHLLAATFSSCVTTCITNPIFMIKTRMQLQSSVYSHDNLRYKNMFDCLSRIIREEGVGSLYRGLLPALSLSSNTVLQFTFYEQLRKRTVKWLNLKSDKELGPIHFMGNGVIAKIMATCITYPLTVMRTRLWERAAETELLDVAAAATKQKYSNVLDVARRVWIHEGIRGFYKGINAQFLATAPGSALIFFFYETTIRLLHTHWIQ